MKVNYRKMIQQKFIAGATSSCPSWGDPWRQISRHWSGSDHDPSCCWYQWSAGQSSPGQHALSGPTETAKRKTEVNLSDTQFIHQSCTCISQSYHSISFFFFKQWFGSIGFHQEVNFKALVTSRSITLTFLRQTTLFLGPAQHPLIITKSWFTSP